MEESRIKVQKTAKVLYVVLKIVRIALIISCIAVLGICIASFFIDDESILVEFKSIFESEGTFIKIDGIDFIDQMSNQVKIAIGCVFHIIGSAVAYVYLTIIGKIFGHIADGEQPFTKKNSRVLFGLSISLLVFVFVNPFISLFLFILGLFLSHLFSYGAYLNDKAEETKHIQESMIVSFAEVVENKSEQTGKHVKRVAEYSKVLAKSLGYSEEEAEKIKMASMMHDIGKLLVPSEILEKPAGLTDEEFMEIKRHPGYGVKLLKDVDGDVLILAKRIAHEHHERFDGRGYPDGLGATSISMEGRIVAVADVYDALTSRRSYKEAWDEAKAYEEIIKGSGTQFDKDVVKAFIDNYNVINEIRVKFADK